ncbi:ribbon-helix-helix protein, CopG family [candidate division WOR-3 bacterium]|nr:ribbon-helix-helix protein, CopG family [candidate division WOR-3 bacterium]
MKKVGVYSKRVLPVRLTPQMEYELERLCKETQRSKSYFVRKALEDFLREESLYRLALERWENKDDPIITAEEMHERLGI